MHDVGVARQHVEAGDELVGWPPSGRAGSSGSRRCRCRWGPTACTSSASARSPGAPPARSGLCRTGPPGRDVAVVRRVASWSARPWARRRPCRRAVVVVAGADRRRGRGAAGDQERRRRLRGRWRTTARCSSRRPGHGTTAEHVHVGVEDGLVRLRAGVEHQAVALAQPLALRDRRGRVEEVRGGLGLTRGEARRRSGSGCAGSPARAWAPAGSGRGRRRWSSDSCTTSASMSPATILQNRQSGSAFPSVMGPACLRNRNRRVNPRDDPNVLLT